MSAYDYAYQKRWKLDRLQGRHRYVPSAPVIEHIRALLAGGASRRSIADAAGVSIDMVSHLLNDPRERTQADKARALLNVTLEDVLRRPHAAGFVPALGARRRIQALLALGWPHRLITEHMPGVRTASSLVLSQAGMWISRETHDAVCAAYEALSMLRGPSPQTRGWAARFGYAPPLAWDEGAIDDPVATPHVGAEARPGVLDTIDEWQRLVRAGEDPHRAAARCNTTPAALERAAFRHDRRDILGLLPARTATRSAA